MPAISNSTLSIASSEPVFTGGTRTSPLTVRRSARARQLRLVVDPRDGAVRLTLPARASLRQALKWVEAKRGWIESTLAALPDAVALGVGSLLPFEGRDLRVVWAGERSRSVRIEDDTLLVGGPEEHVSARLLRWLRAQAKVRLETETRAIAARSSIVVGRVGIGDPRSRWGSCSASGDIRYSWRLILAPRAVLEATVAHEVAHRLHMDHSPAFHRAVTELLGRDPKAERAWLKVHGARIQAIGRS